MLTEMPTRYRAVGRYPEGQVDAKMPWRTSRVEAEDDAEKLRRSGATWNLRIVTDPRQKEVRCGADLGSPNARCCQPAGHAGPHVLGDQDDEAAWRATGGPADAPSCSGVADQSRCEGAHRG